MKKITKLCGVAFSLGLGAIAGSSAFATPANTAFTDDEFYKCIIRAANMDVAQGGAGASDLTAADNITDEQLAAITEVVCGVGYTQNAKIANIAGIEKLTNLETITIDDNSIVTADFSANTHLQVISISKNALTTLKLPASAVIVRAESGTGAALTIDTSKATNLQLLDLEDTKVKAPLDLSKNTKLDQLDITRSGLASLDLTANKDLKSVEVEQRSETVLKISAPLDKKKLTLDLTGYTYPDGFIDPNYTCVGVGYCKFDDKTNIVTITKPENVEGYLQLGLHRIYVPELVEDEPVPSTSTGTVEEPKKEETKKEEKKE